MSLALDITCVAGGQKVEGGLTAPPGQITAIFGPAGSGKTALLRAIAGLARPSRGQITLCGRTFHDSGRGIELPARKRGIGMMFDQPRLLPHFRVGANLAYGEPARDPAHFSRVADQLGLNDLLFQPVAGLTPLQARLVALGRALNRKPELLLLDDPLAGLPAAEAEVLAAHLCALRGGPPILLATSSPAHLAQLADGVAVMAAGRIGPAGTLAEIWNSPALPCGPSTLIEGKISRKDASWGLVHVTFPGGALKLADPGLPIGAKARLRVNAGDVALALAPPVDCSIQNILPARLVDITPDGASCLVLLALGDTRLRARITRRAAEALGLNPGMTCHALVKAVALEGPAPCP